MERNPEFTNQVLATQQAAAQDGLQNYAPSNISMMLTS
jgi:hypothetical protein